jgi:Flp pilus assembly protein TadD
MLFNKKDKKKLDEAYRESIRVHPNDAKAHNNLGTLLKKQGKFDEAENEAREAIRINPNDARTHSDLGIVLAKQGRYDEAEKELEKSKRLNPNLK